MTTNESIIGSCNDCGSDVIHKTLEQPAYIYQKYITSLWVQCSNIDCKHSTGEGIISEQPLWII